MKAIERLYQYFENKGIKPTRFEKDFEISNGYFGKQLKREADIGSSILEKIIDNCRDLNIEWLICGIGEMIISKENDFLTVSEKSETYNVGNDYNNIKKENERLRKQIDVLEKVINDKQEIIDAFMSGDILMSKKDTG